MTENRKIVETLAHAAYWKPEFSDYFDTEFTLEMPMAPPGMPQYFTKGDVVSHFMWMNHTVKEWRTEYARIFGPDQGDERYIVIRDCRGKVRWGGNDGEFFSTFISLFFFKGNKVWKLREYSDPISYLEAAGRTVPEFHMGMVLPPEDDQQTPSILFPPNTLIKEDEPGEEAVKWRKEENLLSFIDHGCWGGPAEDTPEEKRHYTTDPSTICGFAWFVPPGMRDKNPGYPTGDDVYKLPDTQPAQTMIKLSSALTMGGLEPRRAYEDSVFYATDDPNIYFAEAGCYGPIRWSPNQEPPGGYRQRYLMYWQFYDNGHVAIRHEALNPINKYNSVNISIPSFPYFYYEA